MRETDIKRNITQACEGWARMFAIENAISSGIGDTIIFTKPDQVCVLEVKIARNTESTPKIRLRSSQISFFKNVHAVGYNLAFLLVFHNNALKLFNGVINMDQITIIEKMNGYTTVELKQKPLKTIDTTIKALRNLLHDDIFDIETK